MLKSEVKICRYDGVDATCFGNENQKFVGVGWTERLSPSEECFDKKRAVVRADCREQLVEIRIYLFCRRNIEDVSLRIIFDCMPL